MAYQDLNPSDKGIRNYNRGQVLSHTITKTLSTTCSKPKSDHYLEAGFTKKKAGPSHQLESACDSCNAHVGDRLGGSEFWTIFISYVHTVN